MNSYRLPKRDGDIDKQREEINRILAEFDDPGEYAVYTLRCETPDSQQDVIERLDEYYDITDEDTRDYRPMWTKRIEYADEFYYVGMTNDPAQRLLAHVRGISSAALVTTEFPPRELVSIEWYPDEESAEKGESEQSRNLDDYDLTVNLVRGIVPNYGLALPGWVELQANELLEQHNPLRKRQVYDAWLSQIRTDVNFEHKSDEEERAYREWLENNDGPDNPERVFETEQQVIEYGEELDERVDDMAQEINEIHRNIVNAECRPIQVAYSM